MLQRSEERMPPWSPAAEESYLVWWLVSLRWGHFHFCGGSLVQEDMVITAAYCSLVLIVEEHHLQQVDRQEQSIPVSRVIIHPTFNWLHYMDCNMHALLFVENDVKSFSQVQPICLPHRDEDFQAGTLYVVSGWGKVSEAAGVLAPILQELELPLMDSQTCSTLLRGMNLLRVWRSMLCPGFPDSGGRCVQGNSSSALAPAGQQACSVHLQTFSLLGRKGSNLPEDKIVLIRFTKLDVEYQVGYDCDYVSLYLNGRELISKSGCTACGKVFPAPLLADNAGGGFQLTLVAVHKDSEAGAVEMPFFPPGLYPRNTKCHWFIEGPAEYVVKLEFEGFAVELSLGCIYDAITLYGDEEEENQLTNLCGFSNPKPVLSPGNTMLVHFESDGERSSKAQLTFFLFRLVERSYLGKQETCLRKYDKFSGSLADTCGFPPVTPQWLFKCVSGAEEACPHCWPWHAALKAPCSFSVLTPLPWSQERQVKTIMVHPHFNMLNYDSEIALMQLDVLLEYNTVEASVSAQQQRCYFPLPYALHLDGGSLKVGLLILHVSRWLQQTQMPVLQNEICERNYYFSHPGGITARMLCAGFVSVGGQDSCQGGSGAPLVCNKENGPFTPYGIVRWGVGCASPKKPGIYSRVRIFLNWIRLLMKVKHLSITSLLNCQEEFLGIYEESQRGRKEVSSELSQYMDVILVDREGMIQSLGNPMRYTNATSCHWRIVAPLKSIIQLEVLNLWTERNLSNCHG
uniref:Ovochymase-1 n=1 Tax=Otus sunia TaxID=257818 RepID=A0A8C8BCX8_9STRI